MSDEAIEKTSHNEGIFQVVMLFNQVRSEFSTAIGMFRVLGTVPDVPFIKTQVMAFRTSAASLHIPADSINFLNLLVDRVGDCQIVSGISLAVAGVPVQADVIRICADVLQYRAITVHVSG